MAPYAATRRTKNKQHQIRSEEHEEEEKAASMELSTRRSKRPSTSSSSMVVDKETEEEDSDVCGGGCCTPKAEKFRIPELLPCPPQAPKKLRLTPNCSPQTSPISFYASPDIDLFFLFALSNNSHLS
ncbi:cyclin-dependent protein kinase inhibitor SMR9-like [Camellia sinensis]|uniref:cyclin-dependent protein kinase inhibitor SMR9-like n=1 Tax=Camellia sinensis TaxID=4442 RepID=UPI0010355AAD|nr:cyclin-dependent protein kinase inhibitor SMR9-like [Camellia sinensis]